MHKRLREPRTLRLRVYGVILCKTHKPLKTQAKNKYHFPLDTEHGLCYNYFAMDAATKLDLIRAGFRPDPCKAGVWVHIESGKRIWAPERKAA